MKEFEQGYDYVSFYDENEKLNILREGHAIFFQHIVKDKTNHHEMLITKEDYVLYDALRTLDSDIRNINDQNKFYFSNNIYGDDYMQFTSESMIFPQTIMGIQKVNDDEIKLLFDTDEPQDTSVVQLGDAHFGSSYGPYEDTFVKMFESLEAIDPNYRQISIEEYEYTLRKKHQ